MNTMNRFFLFNAINDLSKKFSAISFSVLIAAICFSENFLISMERDKPLTDSMKIRRAQFRKLMLADKAEREKEAQARQPRPEVQRQKQAQTPYYESNVTPPQSRPNNSYHQAYPEYHQRSEGYENERANTENSYAYQNNAVQPSASSLETFSREAMNNPNSPALPPLVRAVIQKDIYTAIDLIKRGANVNVHEQESGITLLHLIAIIYTDETAEPLIRYIIAGGVDVNAQTADGWTAFHYGIKNLTMAGILLKYGARDDIPTLEAMTSFKRGNLAMLHLQGHGPAIDYPSSNANSQLSGVPSYTPTRGEIYLQEPVQTKRENRRSGPQMQAISSPAAQPVRASYPPRQPEKQQENQLHIDLFNALDNDNFSDVQKLVDQGANIFFQGIYGDNFLHHAARCYSKGVEDFIRLLGNRGVDVNAQDVSGNTPLHCAAESNALSCVQVLLALGADRTIKNEENKTPLSIAREMENHSIAALLEGKAVRRSLFHLQN